MKFDSPSQAYEETGSTKAYYAQFPSAVPELGKVYRQIGQVYHMDYKIIYIDDKVALGVCVSDGNNNSNSGEYCLFYSSGVRCGWKYQDNRLAYRLKNLK